MAINFKDVREKLANATRIAGQLKEVVTTEQSLLRNTRESAVATICQPSQVSFSL